MAGFYAMSQASGEIVLLQGDCRANHGWKQRWVVLRGSGPYGRVNVSEQGDRCVVLTQRDMSQRCRAQTDHDILSRPMIARDGLHPGQVRTHAFSLPS